MTAVGLEYLGETKGGSETDAADAISFCVLAFC